MRERKRLATLRSEASNHEETQAVHKEFPADCSLSASARRFADAGNVVCCMMITQSKNKNEKYNLGLQ